MRGIENRGWLVGLTLVLSTAAANARDRSTDLIASLKHSDRPLTAGAGDCQMLAQHHATLGALVTYFEKQANGRKVASCAPKKGAGDPLSCSAEFANKVPRERSEEEFFLKIEFEIDHQSIGKFACFLAG